MCGLLLTTSDPLCSCSKVKVETVETLEFNVGPVERHLGQPDHWKEIICVV